MSTRLKSFDSNWFSDVYSSIKDIIRYLISRVYTHAYVSKKKSNIDTAKESKKERVRVCKREKIVVSFVSKG